MRTFAMIALLLAPAQAFTVAPVTAPVRAVAPVACTRVQPQPEMVVF